MCFAVPEEAHHFVKLLAQAPPNRAEVLITGMGKSSVEKGLPKHLQAATPALVISAGFAGGLQPHLQTGHVIYESTDDNISTRLAGLGARQGRFVCADRVAVTAREKIQLGKSSGGDAVEMESGVIRAICTSVGVTCVTVRVILDTCAEDLPLDFNTVIRPDGKVAPLKLATAIAKRPATIKRLLALRKQTRIAATALGEVLFAAICP